MQKPDFQGLLALAQSIAQSAFQNMLNDLKETREVSEEFSRDVKVEADRRLDLFIVDQLSQKTDYPIISEESGVSQAADTESCYRWIVDPLDGSLNFSREIPMCCISIALWDDLDPLLGVVYDFNRNEIFTGIVKQGAWLNGSSIGPSQVAEPSKAILATGFPVSTDFSQERLLDFTGNIRKYKKIRLFGSAALSLAYVACGRVDSYQENDIKIWDVAAGLALVKAVGGITHYSSSQDESTFRVRVSNPHLVESNIAQVGSI